MNDPDRALPDYRHTNLQARRTLSPVACNLASEPGAFLENR